MTITTMRKSALLAAGRDLPMTQYKLEDGYVSQQAYEKALRRIKELEDGLIQHRRENTIPNDPAVVYSLCTRTGEQERRQG